MLRLFSEARLRPIIAGTLKRVPLIKTLLPKRTGGSINPRYCYSVWLRHLSHLARHNGNRVPLKVAELGPGDSLGIGLAALLSGSEKYFALDVMKYWGPERNIQVLGELLDLFNARADIPDNVEFPGVFPVLEDYKFPSHILNEELLRNSLNLSRVERIKSELMNSEDSNNTIINIKIPWFSEIVIDERSLDLILSQAVMGQVEELENTYHSMNLWLNETGFMTHTIDFRSHGFTRNWNGHWTLSDLEWRIARGGRIFSINRKPISTHRVLLREHGFSILHENKRTSDNCFNKTDLAKRFQNFTDEDLVTSGVFIVAQKT